MDIDLSLCYDASLYAAAAVVAYYTADILVCKGCIRGDGRIKEFLVGYAIAFFMRAVWVVGRRMRIDWNDEWYYWRNVTLAVVIVAAFTKYVGTVTLTRVGVPPPAPPAPEPARRGRRGRRN